MSFWDLLFIAIGLAMDALAVAIGKGLAANGECKKICIITGLYFGSFQTFMPFLGFLCGETISHYITSVSKIVILTTLIISKKPGNTGISRDIRTEFTTDLLLSD